MSYGVNIGMQNNLWIIQPRCIWENDPWHVWAESKGTKNYSTRCAHIDGASIQLDYIWWMLSKATINNL